MCHTLASLLRRNCYIRHTLTSSSIMATSNQHPHQYLLFVYGTLKRGQPNHQIMTDHTKGDAVYIGAAKTVDRYPLVIASKYNIPFLIAKKDIGYQIHGELYSIDDKMLKFLDDFEGYPDFYSRVQIEITSENCQQQLQPWIYLLHHYTPKMLELPYMENYDSSGNHGLPYDRRETSASLEDLGLE